MAHKNEAGNELTLRAKPPQGSKRSCIRKLELHSSYLRRKRAINNGVRCWV